MGIALLASSMAHAFGFINADAGNVQRHQRTFITGFILRFL
jgi:hypothetical protein